MKMQIVWVWGWLSMTACAQQAYFADGYHGGIYGHYPLWHTAFMIDRWAQHPDWKIHLEVEPETWDSVRTKTPDAYVRFRSMAADDRIEFTNPAYAQPYCFNISGESIIRQFEYGIRKVRQHFPDVRLDTYSVEEPCFTSALPQLLRSFGFRYAVLKNPNTCWGGYTRAIENGLIRWEGPDGTELITLPRYACEALEPHSTWQTTAWKNSKEYLTACFEAGVRHPVGMCYQDIGWDNGPWIGSGENTQNGSKYILWREYFSEIAAQETAEKYRLSQEDIQVSLMWGSQVLQQIAQQVRRAENSIVRAEKIAAMAFLEHHTPFPEARMDEAWRTLMLSQHHDSWIVPYNRLNQHRTWADEIALWTANTEQRSEQVIATSVRPATEAPDGAYSLRVYNTQAQARREVVSVKLPEALTAKTIRLRDVRGAVYEALVQTRADGTYLTAQVAVPAFGYASLQMEEMDDPQPSSAAGIRMLPSNRCMVENDCYAITFDLSQGGIITSLIAKKLGNREFVDTSHPQGFDEIRGYFYEKQRFISNREQAAHVTVLEDNAFRKQIRIESMLDESPCIQTLTLHQSQERMDFDVHIHWKGEPRIGEFRQADWRDNRRAFYDDRFKLNVLFPAALNRPKIYKDAPFDVCESQLENTFYGTWDNLKNNVILHWVDAVEPDGACGLALLSDHTTSYSQGADFPLGLTLQYTGNGLWGRDYSIRGPLHVRYALIPHQELWDAAGIGTKSAAWNDPLMPSVQATDECAEHSFLQFDRPGYELSAVKPEGNALIVRIFNQEGDDGPLSVRFGFPVAGCEEIALDGRRLTGLTVHEEERVVLSLPRFGIKTLRVFR